MLTRRTGLPCLTLHSAIYFFRGESTDAQGAKELKFELKVQDRKWRNKIALVDDWDMIPGARGCTPQTCSFRDLFAELKAAGAAHVFGLSTQSNEYQTEMASRLHLPFPVLSDEKLALTRALNLPTMEVAGLTMIKRLALIIDDARITHVFYPVFPPDRNAGDVLAWLQKHKA